MNSLSLIGNTPLIELTVIEKKFELKGKLFAKLEMCNLTGSAKDRVALKIIEDAEKCGKLKVGSVIVEATSGNTGIGLAAIGKIKGYRVIIVMPDNMSKERIDLIKAYGAEVITTPAALGMSGSVAKANEIAQKLNGFVADQFNNKSNPNAHYETTGPEIYRQTNGKIDCLVAGLGTGGTMCGAGRYLKEQNVSVKLIGVEPASSPFLTEGKSGAHKIQGIGAGFLPGNLDLSSIDEILTVSDEDAYLYTKMLAVSEGILAGISSGAALKAACEVAKTGEYKSVVVLLPDNGMRYMSTGVFN